MSIQEQNTTRLSNQNTLHNSPKKAPDSTPQHDAKMRRRLFAARAGFFTGGFTVASWAPIIPFVQTELSLEPAVLGTLLFGLGIGSFFGMPIAGTVSTRFGNRAALAASGVLSCLLLVVLAMIPGFRIECAALLLYGVTLGCLEVSANIYGAQLEKEAGHPLMSGLHAAYSVGEVVSAGAITGLLVLGVPLLWVVGGLMVVLAAVLLWALSGVSPAEGRSAVKSEGMVFAPARGRILMLSLVCMSVFLAEGAMLDWSAIYVHQVGGVDLKAAGVGYTLFVIAMAIARLMGDRMVERFGRAARAQGHLHQGADVGRARLDGGLLKAPDHAENHADEEGPEVYGTMDVALHFVFFWLAVGWMTQNLRAHASRRRRLTLV